MKDSVFLYNMAEEKGIPIFPFPLQETGSLCIQFPDGSCNIGIDENLLKTESEKIVHLGHELGHCCTGSFYNRYSPFEIRQKHENKADKWAIENLISAEDLDGAVADGYTDLWSLAEYFDVTEDFMRKVVCWYTCGNLDIDWYF